MEEHEKYADELLEKEENQLTKVEPVSKALSDMGAIWKTITVKLSEDNICYVCKKKLQEGDKKEEFSIVNIPNEKVDAGIVAFVSVCSKCNKPDEVNKNE